MAHNQGPKSRHVVEPRVRTGSGSKSTRPAGVAQIGQSQGDHVTRQGSTGYRGEKLHNPERNFNPTKYGNEIAAQTVCKPGGSRDVHASGSQQQWGDVAGTR